jgi:tetratricopeptide (TPR) repeat protein
MDRQAAENAKSGTARGFGIGIGLVALIGIGFGATQVFSFFSNFESNQFKRNVAVTLKDPKLAAGKAMVSVEIKNHNAVEISSPVIKYTIASSDNKPLAAGEVKIDGSIPAGDRRSFDQISLAEVSGQPARMHSDLVSIKVGSDKALPKGYPARFAGAFEKNGTDRIAALEPLVNEVKDFADGHVSLGVTYEEQQDWANATKEYKKALEINPNSFNAHYHYGLALAHEQKTPEAIAELKKAAELNPADQSVSKALTALSSGKALPASSDNSSSENSEESSE